ncbi:MAG TPA: DUF255 domain-containing protein [Candidatus Polarisedimenticolia bacterium]|nr:DUF255 domain-containing protein [Candidatus Polarisedimenticolia bacterium]
MTSHFRAVSVFALAACLAAFAAPGARAASGRSNHLAGQSSPYLLQHADNPIDWYPWGEEAFRRATKEDRPIFLSIGYSACHWCHVMERETFSDDEVGRLVNERFVSIKVDREERPDLDAIYMNAVLVMTGRGGWPMTVFLTPDRKPFFSGTYFPKEDFKKLIQSVAEGWKSRRQEVLTSAQTIATVVADLQHSAEKPADGKAGTDLLAGAAGAWKSMFDAQHGGFGKAPKFPPHGALLVLLEANRSRGDAQAIGMVTRTLDAMARGGIYDQIGGGFHRYSTDEKWLTPHFEKMLYDNALLVPVYLDAWKASGRDDFRRIAEETLGWVARDMTDARGGFYATVDADSEGEEGRYYLWTRAQIEEAVGPADGAIVGDYFGVTDAGNSAGGRNILNVPVPPREFAQKRGMTEDALRLTVDRARASLLRARARRPAPHKDDKILAGWNGLMISAYADAYRLTGSADYRRAAESAARFVLQNLKKDGVLRVSWRQGKVGPPGFLDDYAFLARGLLDLYDATSTSAWREEATRLVRSAERFVDRDRGGYFLAAAGQRDLIVRPKSLVDDALPSGNAVMTECLLRLSGAADSGAMRAEALRTLDLAAPFLATSPTAAPYMVLAATMRDGNAAGATGARAAADRAPSRPDPADPPTAGGSPAARGDRVVNGTIVGRPNPQRVATSSVTLPDRPVRPGQAVTMSIRLDIAPTWHVNSNQPSLEYLIPTAVRLADERAARVDQIAYPEAHLVQLKFADTKLSVYEGANTIRVTLRPPSDSAQGERPVPLRLTYQACNDATCLAPETVEFLVPLRIEGEPVPASEAAERAAPLDNAAGGAALIAGPGGAGGERIATILRERGFLAVLGVVFLVGLSLNLTPCIYPMIPVTIGFFASQTRDAWLHRIGLPSLYVLGMAVTYSILGVVAGLSGGLFGSTLQSPWIVGALVILFVAMALGMFGLFEIRLPGAITRLGGGRRGPVGALVMGLTMGLVAAPCIGPFVVGLLAFVGASGSPFLGFWLFFVMAIGMGLPNLVLGVFSGSLSTLPRSGEWLIYAKKVMGVGMLAVALYFLQPFLKDRVLGILIVVFALIAGVYVGFVERTRLASRLFPVLKGAIGVALIAAGIWVSMPLLSAREGPEWEHYTHEAFARASTSGRPILLDFYADWCLPCRELDRFTFSDAAVLEETRRFSLLKADLTQLESEQVRQIRDRFEVIGVPTLVFIDAQGNEHKDLRVYGFEDAQTLLARLRQVR